jgi:peptidoglycan/xylan/chitin deacetylase (PgdA/CDA1 family)
MYVQMLSLQFIIFTMATANSITNNQQQPTRRYKSCCSTAKLLHKPVWRLATSFGMRRLGRLVKRCYPREYGETLTHFQTGEPVICLTIDDGLSRGGPETSMVSEVLDLLAKYNNAHATFFVCSDYVTNLNPRKHPRSTDTGNSARVVKDLLQQGHELGNHMIADKLWYYNKLGKREFLDQLRQANAVLEDLEATYGFGTHTNDVSTVIATTTRTRWFRAPQGIMTEQMKEAVLEEGNMVHVLGDCYCDDWSFAEEADPLFAQALSAVKDSQYATPNRNYNLQKQKEKAMKQVSDIMLKQVKPGSIAILHMPEKGFRQGNLLALEFFLQGIQNRGWRCCNLSEMSQLCGTETSLIHEPTKLTCKPQE